MLREVRHSRFTRRTRSCGRSGVGVLACRGRSIRGESPLSSRTDLLRSCDARRRAGIVDAYVAATIFIDKYRGRCCYPSVTQVGRYFLRDRPARLGLDDFTLRKRVKSDHGQSVSTDDGVHEIDASAPIRHRSRLLTCQCRERPSRFHNIELLSYTTPDLIVQSKYDEYSAAAFRQLCRPWGQAFLPSMNSSPRPRELGFGGVMLMAKRPHVSILDYGRGARSASIQARTARNEDLCHRGILQSDGGPGARRYSAAGDAGPLHRRTGAACARSRRQSRSRLHRVRESRPFDLTRQWRLIVDSLREASRRAADFGVTIGVQNHHDIGVGYQSLTRFDHGSERAELPRAV